MKFKSKAHMAQELIAGKRFGIQSDIVIYYDPNFQNPFRCNGYEMSSIWDEYSKDIWEEVKPKHVHQDLIDTYQEGQVWQYRHNSKASWLDLSNHLTSWQPDWDEDTQYRLHPHNDLIQAFNKGAKIEYLTKDGWTETTHPTWNEDTQYRIKPVTKIVYEWVFKSKYANNWKIESLLFSEEEAKEHFKEHTYCKTGREFEVEA